MAVDYAALAKQNGGMVATPSTGVDYAALAKKSGGAVVPTTPAPASAPVGTGNPVLDTNPVIKTMGTNAKTGNVPAFKFGNPVEDVKSAGADVNAAITGTGQYAGQGSIRRGFSAASSAALAVPTVAADVIPGGKAALGILSSAFGGATKIAGNIHNTLADISQKLGMMSPEQRTQYDKQASDFANSTAGQTTTHIANTLNSLGNIANVILGAGGAPEAIKNGTEALTTVAQSAKQAASTLTDAISKNDPAAADNYINTQYTKAIRPSIAGKTAPGQIEKYNANVNDAIKTIVQNKPNLSLVDSTGETTGKLPQTIDQFRQAIEQTKSNIFKQYDAMAKTAGDKGATVDLSPAVTELRKVAGNKVVQDLHPDLAAYAESRAKTLESRGSYSTEDAQAAVQNLNKSLDAYYRNPSYETASKANVDSLIANQLRDGLDKSIERAGAPGYQGLKNQYASLKAIEKDVIKRGIVEARQTGGRGMNVGDIVTAEELVRGLATMNPQALATAGAIKSIAALRRYLTDPNRAVRQLFEKADATTQTPSNPEIPSATEKVVPSGNNTPMTP